MPGHDTREKAGNPIGSRSSDYLPTTSTGVGVGEWGRASVEIADQDYGECDHHGGDSEKEHVPDVMPGYALPFRDVSHDRPWLTRRCFEMVA